MPDYSENFNLPYPTSTDPVNVHGDFKSLVDVLNNVLPPLGIHAFQISVINKSGQTLEAGWPVYITGNSTKPEITYADHSTNKPILGLLKQQLANNEEGIVVVAGVMDGINLSSSEYTIGNPVYVGSGGGLSGTRPSDVNAIAVGVVAAVGSNGILIVQAKGNGTWGALKDGLS
jgi:subtilisin family serine protease